MSYSEQEHYDALSKAAHSAAEEVCRLPVREQIKIAFNMLAGVMEGNREELPAELLFDIATTYEILKDLNEFVQERPRALRLFNPLNL